MSNIILHPGQSMVYRELFLNDFHRFIVAVCSRGWGKSYFAATTACTAVSQLLTLPRSVPNKRVGIIAPTHDQVTDIYYPMLAYEMGLEDAALKSSKDLGRFWFPNDVELHLISYEAVERMRGKGYYLIVCDEPSSWTKGLGLKDAWQGIIEPCIVTRWSPHRVKMLWNQYINSRANGIRPGRALIIGTPKGYNYLYDMYNAHEKDALWKSFHFDYTTSPYLDPDEIERLRHTIDPLEFNSEYKATFEDSGLRVFYNFARKLHVTDSLEYFRDDEDVHIGIDFNVGKLSRPTINLVNSGKTSKETILIQAYLSLGKKEQRLSRKGVHWESSGSAKHYWILQFCKSLKVMMI